MVLQPFAPGLGGGGNSRSFNNDARGVDGPGGGGSADTSINYPPSFPVNGGVNPSSVDGGDGIVILEYNSETDK